MKGYNNNGFIVAIDIHDDKKCHPISCTCIPILEEKYDSQSFCWDVITHIPFLSLSSQKPMAVAFICIDKTDK